MWKRHIDQLVAIQSGNINDSNSEEITSQDLFLPQTVPERELG
jgi:hypothetical protein